MPEFLKPVAAPRRIAERTSRASGWFYEVGELLYSAHTGFQTIELFETPEFGRVLLLDGALQVMEKYEFQYHEPIAHLALLAHPDPKRVLLIGGGDGGSLRETLKHSCVEKVDFVELDAEVTEFSRRYLSSINGQAFDDPRVNAVFMDGRAFVERSLGDSERWDVVIMDMVDPQGPALMLYTVEFFRHIRSILRDERSFFVMHSESPDSRPEAFAIIRRSLASVFPLVRGAYAYTRMYNSLWSFALASQSGDPAALAPNEVAQRLTARGISGLKLVSAESWAGLFARYPYIENLIEGEGPVATDANPEFPDSLAAEVHLPAGEI